MTASPVLTALAEALASTPGRPLVTYDDRATGERIELSVATFDNWVNKLANLFTDDLMLDPGSSIAIRLPAHWQSTVLVVGAWTAGLCLVDPTGPADVTVVGPDALDTGVDPGGQVLACSLRPLGGPFGDTLPSGWLDFAREVPPQPDLLLTRVDPDAGALAARITGQSVTHADLAGRATAVAAEMGLAPGGRLATDANPAGVDGLSAALAAPILLQGSVVLVRGADDATRADVVRQEGATCTHWLKSGRTGTVI